MSVRSSCGTGTGAPSAPPMRCARLDDWCIELPRDRAVEPGLECDLAEVPENWDDDLRLGRGVLARMAVMSGLSAPDREGSFAVADDPAESDPEGE